MNAPLSFLVNEAIQRFDIAQALELVADLKKADLADLLEQMPAQSSCQLLEYLPRRAKVFAKIDPDYQSKLVHEFSRASLAEIIAEMPADKRTDLFKRLDLKEQEALLPALAQAQREDIRRLSTYQEETAGAIMTSQYITLSQDMTVTQAMETLRRLAPDAETIYESYIVDEKRRLIGVVSLHELVLAPLQQKIQELMSSDVISAYVDDDQDDVAKKIARYDLLALPVIDHQRALLGIVTYDDAMDVASEEASEDFLKVGGVEASAPSLNIKEASLFLLYRKRVFWLVILVFGSLLSGLGIAHFESVIESNIVLVFFLPLLVGSGGNAGSQSSTLMVRALATGDVVMKDWFKLLSRECVVALGLGVTMAIAVAILGYIRGDAMVALVLILSMIGIVLIGSIIGMSLPFILDRIGLDPASASAPLVTSICDATGVIIYLFIAAQLLNNVAL
ncbi:magnesium transporter [Acinetobacter sp. S40]|nr:MULTISPECIES: magnesium transporter [unclassified Acinetobacter]MBJ9985372.1 magnesium transporter [Acinetobacter sp. S40]MBK0063722.1 magnesium transporter [Acinetobacter sp. S55]MBK0066989.1 magnesium transporter [Acinetobacter sp. S54]